MKTKRFHISDVLSVTTSRLVSNRHMEGIYDILNFMTGENLFTHQLPRAMKQCEPFLKAQLPQLATAELEASIVAMCEALPEDKAEAHAVLSGWLAKAAETHGEWFDVKPLPAGEDGPRDPIQELADMVGKDRVVVVALPE